MGILDAPVIPKDAAGKRLDSFPIQTSNRRRSLHALGDSITANGVSTVAAGLSLSTPQCPWVWASLLSDGRLRVGKIGATGGYTTSQIISTHLPIVVAAIKPGDYVGVLGGTNDVTGAVPTATIIANLLTIWKAVEAKGGTPLCCSIPPRTDDDLTLAGARLKLNSHIEYQAELNGWPFIDFYSVLADPAQPGKFLAGVNTDATHPNGVGAKAMGQLVVDQIIPITAAARPYLANFNAGTSTGSEGVFLIGNATMQTDANGNGVPDQFNTLAGTLDGGSSYSLVTVPGCAGKMFKITRGDTGTANIIAATSPSAVPVAAGSLVEVSFKFKFDITAGNPNNLSPATNAYTICQLVSGDGTAIAGFGAWDTPTPLSTFTSRFVMPTVATQTLQWSISARVAGCSVYIGQLTIRNLTALGLA